MVGFTCFFSALIGKVSTLLCWCLFITLLCILLADGRFSGGSLKITQPDKTTLNILWVERRKKLENPAQKNFKRDLIRYYNARMSFLKLRIG